MRYFYRDVPDGWFSCRACVIDGARYIAAFQRLHPIAYAIWYHYPCWLENMSLVLYGKKMNHNEHKTTILGLPR